jgi:hypothetical protein
VTAILTIVSMTPGWTSPGSWHTWAVALLIFSRRVMSIGAPPTTTLASVVDGDLDAHELAVGVAHRRLNLHSMVHPER